MELIVVQIGDSKGIILPEEVLESYDIAEKIELVSEKDCLLLRPVSKPRKGWDAAFKEMHENGDDELLIDDIFVD